MSKPDWKSAPEWANWRAMDADGQVFWYEQKPEKSLQRSVWDPTGGKVCPAYLGSSWADSLEERSRG